MVITEMSEHECLRELAQGRMARLGCARENQPYVVPIYYAYHKSTGGASYLYGFTSVGQKVEWMRANPRVCVEWDDVASYKQWVSVIAFGSYEELSAASNGGASPPHGRLPMRATPLPDDTDGEQELRLAAQLLSREHSTWWQPGWAAYAASEHRDRTQPYSPLYYRIRIDRITGHRAIPDEVKRAEAGTSAREATKVGWMRRALQGFDRMIPSWKRRSH